MESVEKVKEYMKGTTTVGLTCKDGVVLVSDKRATMGNLVAHKFVNKSFVIDRHIGATVAGSVGDAQALVRWMQAESKLYRMRKTKKISVEGLSTLIGNVLFGQRLYPLIVQLIIGGVDSTGAKIFSLDPLGSNIEDKMIATGSGSPFAYGVLEDMYKENMSINDAVKIGARALTAALNRDAFTGNGIDIIKITKDGARKLPAEDVEKVIKTL